MASSGTVAVDDNITATQYNNLRKDVLENHGHSGSADDGAQLSNDAFEDKSITYEIREPIQDYVYIPAIYGYNHNTSSEITPTVRDGISFGIALPASVKASAYASFALPNDILYDVGPGTATDAGMYVLGYTNGTAGGSAYAGQIARFTRFGSAVVTIYTSGTSQIDVGTVAGEYKSCLEIGSVWVHAAPITKAYPTVVNLEVKRHGDDEDDNNSDAFVIAGWYLKYKRKG